MTHTAVGCGYCPPERHIGLHYMGPLTSRCARRFLTSVLKQCLIRGEANSGGLVVKRSDEVGWPLCNEVCIN